jgi:hypothetical protein
MCAVQEIPWEELEADESDKIISVFHFSKEVGRTHGVPFKFVVKTGEKFSDTKKRLQARIGVSDKDFAKYRFALIQVATFKQPSYIEDGASAAVFVYVCWDLVADRARQTTRYTTTSGNPRMCLASTTSIRQAGRGQARARRRS